MAAVQSTSGSGIGVGDIGVSVGEVMRLTTNLDCFERIARGQGWLETESATALSLCLTEEALNTFGRMPAEDSFDYEKVKVALLSRFRLTTEGLREKFKKSKAEDAKSGVQFSTRLAGYLDQWIELSGTLGHSRAHRI